MSASEYILCEKCGVKLIYTELAVLDESRPIAYCARCFLQRWIPTDDPPDNIKWEEKVLVLECDEKIPVIMTMAEIFLDEESEAEYWMPIPEVKQ